MRPPYVLVECAKGFLYYCQPLYFGWQCGNCAKHNFGTQPKAGDSCSVCSAHVVEIITPTTHTESDKG